MPLDSSLPQSLASLASARHDGSLDTERRFDSEIITEYKSKVSAKNVKYDRLHRSTCIYYIRIRIEY